MKNKKGSGACSPEKFPLHGGGFQTALGFDLLQRLGNPRFAPPNL